MVRRARAPPNPNSLAVLDEIHELPGNWPPALPFRFTTSTTGTLATRGQEMVRSIMSVSHAGTWRRDHMVRRPWNQRRQLIRRPHLPNRDAGTGSAAGTATVVRCDELLAAVRRANPCRHGPCAAIPSQSTGWKRQTIMLTGLRLGQRRAWPRAGDQNGRCRRRLRAGRTSRHGSGCGHAYVSWLFD